MVAAPHFPIAAICAGLLALSACTGTDAPAGRDSPDTPVTSPATGAPAFADDVPAPAGPADCNADKAERFVGRRATPEVQAELGQAVAPVETIRWVGPGQATTEDYSLSRLNVMLDAGGTILSVHCG